MRNHARLSPVVKNLDPGIAFHVDATNGNDSNNGRTTATPWLTAGKVAGESFTRWQNIRFKRGETLRELITLPSPGIYGAYGSGPKPIFNGADVMGTWTSYSANTWQKTGVTTEPLQTFMDGVKLTEGSDRDSLNDHEWVWALDVLYVRDETGDPDGSGVIIEAAQRTSSIDIGDQNYVTLSNLNCKINNNVNRGVIQDYDNTGATDRAGITIDSCEVSYSVGQGIRIDIDHASGVLTNLILKNNYSHHNQKYGFRIIGTTSDSYETVNIYSNTTDNNQDEGIRIDQANDVNVYLNTSTSDGLGGAAGILIGGACTNTKVYRNWIKDPGAEGIWCQGTGNTGLQLYYNVMFGGGNFGIHLDQAGDDTVIYNNIIYDMDGGIAIGITAQSLGVLIKNNLIDALNSTSGNIETRNSSTYTSDNNVWDENKNLFPENVSTSWANWQVAGNDANGYHEDAKMVDPGSEDFTLASDSPARDAGADVSLTKDYADVDVPQETNPAIGAYEYVA